MVTRHRLSLFAFQLVLYVAGFSVVHAQTAATPQKSVPQRVVYSALFRHVIFLQPQASALDQQGKNGSALRDFYQTKAGLTAAEAAALNQASQNAATALQAAEAQIHTQVKALRTQTPRPSPKSGPPPLPPILKTLQAQKDAAIMNQVAALYTALGPARFHQFDAFVQSTLTPHIAVSTIPPGH